MGIRQKTLLKQSQKLQLTIQKPVQKLAQAKKLTLRERQAIRQIQRVSLKAISKPAVTKKRLLIVKRKKGKKPVKKEARRGYNVFGKSKGKFIRLNRIPLSKAQARDRGSFAIDKSTSATFKIVAVGKRKKIGKVGKGEVGHFARTRKKFRKVKFKRKRKIAIRNKFIEKKGRPRIDTRGEKKGLKLAKFAKQRGFIGKRKVRKTKRGKSIKRKVRRRSKK